MWRVGHEVEGHDEQNGYYEANVLERYETNVRSNAVNVENSSDDSDLHEASQSSTTVVGRNFSDVHRLSCHDKTNAKTLQQSGDVDLRNVAREYE